MKQSTELAGEIPCQKTVIQNLNRSKGEEGEGEKEADMSLDPLKLLPFQTIETSHGASKTLDFES